MKPLPTVVARVESARRRWRRELAGSGGDERRVHAARVALKEARALMRLFGSPRLVIDAHRWDRRLRKALRALALERDAMVARTVLLAHAGDLSDPADRELLARALPLPRPVDPRALAVVGPLLAELVLALKPVAASTGWRPLDAAVAASVRRVRRLQKRAGKDPTPDLWHRWRRRVKELAFQARWACPAGSPEARVLQEAAWRLQSRLGELQDLHVALDHLDRLELPKRVRTPVKQAVKRAARRAARRAWRERLP